MPAGKSRILSESTSVYQTNSSEAYYSLVLVSSTRAVRCAIVTHGESMEATFGANEASIEVILESIEIETAVDALY